MFFRAGDWRGKRRLTQFRIRICTDPRSRAVLSSDDDDLLDRLERDITFVGIDKIVQGCLVSLGECRRGLQHSSNPRYSLAIERAPSAPRPFIELRPNWPTTGGSSPAMKKINLEHPREYPRRRWSPRRTAG